MRRVVEYSESHRELWTNFVNRSPNASIAHQIGFRKVIEDGLGMTAKYLAVHLDDRLTGILPLFKVKTWWNAVYLVSVPWLDYGGICADDDESERLLLDEAKRLANREGANFIELRSEHKSHQQLVDYSHRVTFLMELSAGADAIWTGFDPKLRNQVRKSQNSGLTVQYGGLELLDEFYKVFAWKMHELGTPVWGKKLFAGVLTEFSDSVELALVKKDSETVTGALVLRFKDRMYVPSAASYRQYLKQCPYHALYWNTIGRAIEKGCKYFDFGRSSVNSSTYNFKKQWVEVATPLEWQYSLHRVSEVPEINPGNPKYSFAKWIWSRMPLPLANLLGPAVIKNFP